MTHSNKKINFPTYFNSNSVANISSPELLQNWIELSQSAVEANAQQFKTWLGAETQISGVIKSNAYGHGLVPIAMLYEKSKNIASLSVINLSEAIILRENGIKKPILAISYLDRSYDFITQYGIEVVVYDLKIAQQLNRVGEKNNTKIVVHIKFDTGMSRLGIDVSSINEFINQVKLLKFITIKGVFTHLSEGYNKTTTLQQESIFAKIMDKNLVTHISNSHGSLTTAHKNYTFARIGIGLYGYMANHPLELQNKLKPVLSLKTRILQIKEVPAGSFVGYDAMYKATSSITVAILAIGYAEGIDSRLSNIGKVIIDGQFAPIVGRVCMNLTIVDISSINNCNIGQVVTILGKEGNSSITVCEWSNLTKLTTYNLLTKLSHSLIKIITA